MSNRLVQRHFRSSRAAHPLDMSRDQDYANSSCHHVSDSPMLMGSRKGPLAWPDTCDLETGTQEHQQYSSTPSTSR